MGNVARPDKVQLSAWAEQHKARASGSIVTIGRWGSGKNECLTSALKSQGFSQKEMYTRDQNGMTLVDRVVADNDLKNPNLVTPGQKLPENKRGLLLGATSNFGAQTRRPQAQAQEKTGAHVGRDTEPRGSAPSP